MKLVGYVAGRGVPGVYCGHTRLPVCTLYLLWVQPMRQFAMGSMPLAQWVHRTMMRLLGVEVIIGCLIGYLIGYLNGYL